MPTHKAFESAGKQPGLQIWRVEKMELAEVPKELHGSFYMGDSYVILHTSSSPSYNVHTWIGGQTSQDEKGAAAILMTQLDDYLAGAPTQSTEFQGQESLTFLGYFKHGLKYQKGGVASGFRAVVPNQADVRRLLHVKGRRHVRATEVSLTWDSFNRGDCFIIDLGKDIYHWAGGDSNRYERLKATQLAIDIRDNERRGRAELHLVDEGDEPEEVIEVLGAKPDLPPGSSDACTVQKCRNPGSLYKVSDASGKMALTLVAQKNPFKQDMLSCKECYILDNGQDNKIFFWKGRESNPKERKAALSLSNQFIEDKNYSDKCQVQVLPQGAESTLFKEFFENWLDKDESTGPGKSYTVGSIAVVKQIPFDAASLHDNKVMAAHHGMADDGSGKVQVFRVEGGDRVPVDAASHGQFYGGDCYLLLYSYHSGDKEKHIIYIWQGNKCSKDELGASAILAVALDDSMGGVAVQVRVSQGQEPPHLLSLFGGKPLVVYLGGTSRKGGNTQPAATRLFHIRQSCTGATRAVEVPADASCLNSNDVFVLKWPKGTFVWKGRGATPEETAAAKHVTGVLGGGAPAEVAETKEPESFWKALGGRKDYQTSVVLRTAKMWQPRLFGCSNASGRLTVEEVPGELDQLDLETDDVMILDTCQQLFVWIGKDANEPEKSGAGRIAQEYLESDPSGRHGVPVTTIKQGEEPPSFTGWFHAWDAALWDKDLLARIGAR
ncbi:gelsolin-like [Syngnathoides biaculeatus]|uniref:gelsolin-like n=1 Tax=Syngnathoides biaculeatus TaxID=300417 RepID=UPI002ADDAB0B|nr:gelsolin-like [Syngnathoides biaculeatus]XP_061680670.1 gelsolin-like [Syngnathoides biaculeatus]XP_061680671.1 gelsolin-like [Syngnathoides biaculeatus]